MQRNECNFHKGLSCSYASCIDCCIGHSNSALAGPNLVSSGGGGCGCLLLLHPASTCPDAAPDLCTLCWCCVLPSTGTNTPLAHVVVSICCNLCWWCFSIHQLVQILHLHTWWSSPAATCVGGVCPSSHWRTYSTCTHATCTVWWRLHLVVVCGGASCIFVAVVVVYSYIIMLRWQLNGDSQYQPAPILYLHMWWSYGNLHSN